MITMMKNRSRNLFIKTARFNRRLLLKFFRTCDLVAALEARTDVCTTVYAEPYRTYYIGVDNEQRVEQMTTGPAVILVVVD